MLNSNDLTPTEKIWLGIIGLFLSRFDDGQKELRMPYPEAKRIDQEKEPYLPKSKLQPVIHPAYNLGSYLISSPTLNWTKITFNASTLDITFTRVTEATSPYKEDQTGEVGKDFCPQPRKSKLGKN